MNKYNPNIHHRRSIRLKGYDYSQAGLYFITICLKNRECLFGEITNGTLKLNDAGQMIEKWYVELENKFPDIKCHEMIIMPNHFHCIVENVGADLRVCPNTPATAHRAITKDCPNKPQLHTMPPLGKQTISGEHVGSPLHRVVQWFKTMTTNEYIRSVKTLDWKPFDGKLWQRNYWEHIIRNEQSYNTISEYIKNNAANWQNDKFNAE